MITSWSIIRYVLQCSWIGCSLRSSLPAHGVCILSSVTDNASLQCYSVLRDILVKNELCIPLERGSNVPSTGEGFICLSPPSKLKIAVRFCSIYKQTISFSAKVFLVIFIQWPMIFMSRDWVSSVSYCSIYKKSLPLEKLLNIGVTSLT